MSELTDTDEMPFGKHKGELMEDVPAQYLLWLYDQGLNEGNVKDYIDENFNALEKEAEK